MPLGRMAAISHAGKFASMASPVFLASIGVNGEAPRLLVRGNKRKRSHSLQAAILQGVASDQPRPTRQNDEFNSLQKDGLQGGA